jgi:hypothetical protein
VQVPHCSWQSKILDEAPYKLSGAVAKLASITFWSLAFSWIRLNLGFFLREKLADVLIIPSSWGSQLDGDLHHQPCRIKTLFWRRCWGLKKKKKLPRHLHFPTSTTRPQTLFWCHCRGKRRLLQGEFRIHILYFVLSFALLYFYLHRFIKNIK